MPTFSFHSSSATRERALSAICTSAYLLASEGGRYAGAGAGRYGRDRPSARGAVSGRRKRTEEPIIDFCINNGIIGTGGIRLCPDRVEALIYWKIGASGLWLC